MSEVLDGSVGRLNGEYERVAPIQVEKPGRLLGIGGATRAIRRAEESRENETFRSVMLQGDTNG